MLPLQSGGFLYFLRLQESALEGLSFYQEQVWCNSACKHFKLSYAQALSMDGRCKTFEASADGYGRGEGFAVAYLSPSSAATQPAAILQARPHCPMHIEILGAAWQTSLTGHLANFQ